jgi:3alpha(or 20beta)-hydroxysteroid dehydrogenase
MTLAIVTGAASGIGHAITETLNKAGFDVLALDRSAPTEPIMGVEYRVFDVTEEKAWVSLAAEIKILEVLVNAAGIAMRSRITDIDLESWNRALSVNLTGPMLSIRHLAAKMQKGSIVNIGSVAGLAGHVAVAYTTSKWALRGLTHSAANVLGAQGIRVNIVHPGYIETPLMASANPKFRDAHVSITPMGRTGTAAEVAAAVAYLVSPGATYVNGAELTVDGGFVSSAGTKLIADATQGS